MQVVDCQVLLIQDVHYSLCRRRIACDSLIDGKIISIFTRVQENL